MIEESHEVIRRIYQEPDEVIFRGSLEDCKIIEEKASQEHFYDRNIVIEIIPVKIPEYASVEEYLNDVGER